MSFKVLRRKIGTLRRQIAFLIVLQGISVLLFCSVGFYAFSFSVDYLLDLPRPGRFIVFLAFIALEIYCSIRFLLVPLRRPLSDDELVLAVEKSNPHLQERLIAAFQFQKLLEDPEYQDSREMSQTVIEEAQQLSGEIDFSGILNWLRFSLIALFALICCAAVFLFDYSLRNHPRPRLAKLPALWIQRDLLMADVSWPRSNDVFLLCDPAFMISPKNKVDLEVIPTVTPESKILLLYHRRVEDSGYGSWKETRVDLLGDKFIAKGLLEPKSIQFYFQIGKEFSRLYKIEPDETSLQSSISLKFPDYRIVKKRGESLPLQVVVKGEKVDESWVYYRPHNRKQRRENLLPVSGEQNVFRYDSFQTLTEDVSFYFKAGDDKDQLPEYHIAILDSPSIDDFSFWFTYPAYTNRVPTDKNNPIHQRHGNIKGFPGTRVTMRIAGNIPLEDGKLEFEMRKGKEVSVLPLEFRNSLKADVDYYEDIQAGKLPDGLRKFLAKNGFSISENAIVKPRKGLRWMLLDEIKNKKYGYLLLKRKNYLEIYDSKHLYADFTIEKNLSYKVILTPLEGLADNSPSTYFIRVQSDIPPLIKRSLPESDRLKMTLAGKVELDYQVEDDFGLDKLSFLCQVNQQEDWWEIPLKSASAFDAPTLPACLYPPDETKNSLKKAPGINKYPKKLQINLFLKIGEMKKIVTVGSGIPPKKEKLVKGDRVFIKLMAKDNNPDLSKGKTESKAIVIRVLSKGELREILDQRLQQLKRQLRRISEQQIGINGNLEDFLAERNNIQAGDVATILQWYVIQGDISRDIADISHEIDKILTHAKNNLLWDSTRQEQIKQVQIILDEVAYRGKGQKLQGKSPMVSKLLMESYNRIYSDRKFGLQKLEDAGIGQKKILENIELAIGKLGEWESFHELVRDVEAFVEQEKLCEKRLKTLDIK